MILFFCLVYKFFTFEDVVELDLTPNPSYQEKKNSVGDGKTNFVDL